MVAAPVAFAQASNTYTTTLGTLNGSGASGEVTVEVTGSQATVTVNSQGLTPHQPHAQHIHIGGQNVCPPPSADTDGSGTISVAEGLPFYGDIQVSLTTQGDVSADSARGGPPADGRRERQPQLLANGVIVQHGIDLNGHGEYDASAGQSLVDSLLLFEGTVPAACGELAQAGGMTGLPDTGGPNLLLIAGGLLLASSGVLGIAALRRRAS